MIDDDAVFRPQPVSAKVLASSSTPFAAFGFHRVDLRPRGSKPRMGPARVEVPPAAMPSRTVRPTPSAAASRASAGPARRTVRCPSQPTLWGHASRVPSRGWRGTPPLRSPIGRLALRCGVRVRPAADWFRSLPIARGLAAPLAPNARAGRGPRSRPRHRLPPQPRRRRAPPGVDTGGEHDGAAVRGGRTGDGFGGRPARPLRRQPRATLGVRRGAQHPLARPQCSTLRGLAPVR